MKFVIQQKVGCGKTAGSKAVRDVNTILKSSKYVSLDIYPRWYHYILSIIKVWFVIKRKDHVLMQWPFYKISIKPLLKILFYKKVNLTLLLHDVNSYRNVDSSMGEDLVTKYADKIIVHTDSMKDYFVRKGIPASKLTVLTSFDYLTDDEIPIRSYSNVIVYAGNLQKSEFLQKIPCDNLGLVFNCYGLYGEMLPKHLSYQGVFSPENVSVLSGSWGLVWDGDSIDTCNGVIGRYLKINSPHKISLYIVSGLPVIVWQKSGLANYVKENNLGIVVESLTNIKDTISKISPDEYNGMVKAVIKEAGSLRNGMHLKKAMGIV